MDSYRYLFVEPAGPGQGPLDHPPDGSGQGPQTTPGGKAEAQVTTATKAPPKPFAIRRDAEGWWFYVGHTNTDEPWYGPWATKADAGEALRSWKRNNISSQRPGDIKSEWRNRRKLPGAK